MCRLTSFWPEPESAGPGIIAFIILGACGTIVASMGSFPISLSEIVFLQTLASQTARVLFSIQHLDLLRLHWLGKVRGTSALCSVT